MKLGYITKQDPADPKAYSGIHFNMLGALNENFEQVYPFGPVDSAYKIIPKVTGRIRRAFSGKVYKYQYNKTLARKMAGIIEQKIRAAKPDVLLASLMTPEIACLETDVPLFITTDATFPLLNEVYQSHSNLHRKSIKEAMELEKMAFEKAAKLILPLKWLADSAIKDYGISPSKIEVIPYGSNLGYSLAPEEVEDVIQSRLNSDTINILFVGVRWEEKGGPFSVEILKKLLEQGVKAELWIAGCIPDIPGKPAEVNVVGFLDKSIPEQSDLLISLYKKAGFFLMPTKAECVGMSFIEAASMGLPAIGSEVGGVPEAIGHNGSGYLINKRTAPREAADWIQKMWEDKSGYRDLSLNAYNRYSVRMNWENWGREFRRVVEESL